MNKHDLTLQHRFVGYMILSTLAVALLSYGLTFVVQNNVARAILPAETTLVGDLENLVITVPSSPAMQTHPAAALAQPVQEMTGTVIAVPAETISRVASRGIEVIKGDVVASSQRQYLMLLSGVLALQFAGSMLWVRHMLVRPLRATVKKIDLLAEGEHHLEPAPDGRHELVHLNHQIYRLSEELRMNTLQREEQAAQRKALIAGISHDLKTPLTNICGYTETLMMEVQLAEEQHSWLNIILRNARQANQLLDNLLDLNRYDHQQYPVSRSPVAITELMGFCMADVAARLEEKNQQMRFANEATEDTIFETDRLLLLRLMKNLVDNFCKYAGDGTTLTIGCQLIEGRLHLTFSDDGAGVDAEEVPHLTDIFRRADPSRTGKGGSGLGLYNCAQIVGLLGGTMTIESAKGKGMQTKVILKGMSQEDEV